MGPKEWLRLLSTLLLVLAALDVSAQRRSVRVDAGSWTDPIAIPSPSCPGAEAGSTLVTIAGHVFSGRDDPAHLTNAYCQLTEPGSFSSDSFDQFADPGEIVLADMVGDNVDDRASAIRYAMLDDEFAFSATGFQWAFYQFPSGGMIAALYGFEDPGFVFDASSYIEDGHARHWDGAQHGYQGEYFCFQDERFLDSWDGTLQDPSACLLIGYRLFRGDFE